LCCVFLNVDINTLVESELSCPSISLSHEYKTLSYEWLQ